jgi:hypothetical protein
VEGRKGTVENVEFVAHWNSEVYNVFFTIIRNVDPERSTFNQPRSSRER